MRLPKTLRPDNSNNRECQRGIDLPSWFFDELKAIDSNFYIVWHPYATIWDNIINQYEGALEDPRFTIHREYGEEVWGWVTTKGDGSPIIEQAWHVWRLCEPYGWAHVIRIDSKASHYLSLLTSRLHTQGAFRDKYGDIAWNRQIRDEQEEAQFKAQEDKQAEFDAVQDENAWLTKNAMDQMERGVTAPTNPMIHKIISYPNQKNRGTHERPLRDEDVGLKTIEDL